MECSCPHRKKRPAGAVSLFGGADLFGGQLKKTEPPETTPTEATPPAPAKKPPKSSGFGGGLFDDGAEGEDIFSFSPPNKKSK